MTDDPTISLEEARRRRDNAGNAGSREPKLGAPWDALLERSFTDPGAPFEATALAALAQLRKDDRPRFEQVRRSLSTAKVRVGELDKALDKLGTGDRVTDSDSAPGQPLDLPTPEPWGNPVDGEALLDAIAAAVRRHVVLTLHAATAIALWILHTHLLAVCFITARLLILSPTKECGKTTLLDCLRHMVARPLMSGVITSASIYRVIEACHPTLIMDEGDLRGDAGEELRKILNVGYRRGFPTIKAVIVNNNYEPRQFDTFAAVAIAAIGRLWPTVEDRAVSIHLRRRRQDEPITRFRQDRVEHLTVLGRQCARWAADNAGALMGADPVMPASLRDREADNWRALVCIADRAGGRWPGLAREAAVALSGVSDDSNEAPGLMLLADIKAVIAGWLTDGVPSATIVDRLVELEGRPWAEWRRGKPITTNGLAKLLKPFEIKPTVRREGSNVFRGYLTRHFDDAFARYLPSDPLHRCKPQDSGALSDPAPVTPVTDGSAPRITNSATCNGVTDEERP